MYTIRSYYAFIAPNIHAPAFFSFCKAADRLVTWLISICDMAPADAFAATPPNGADRSLVNTTPLAPDASAERTIAPRRNNFV